MEVKETSKRRGGERGREGESGVKEAEKRRGK
jgi:hypothetical protein